MTNLIDFSIGASIYKQIFPPRAGRSRQRMLHSLSRASRAQTLVPQRSDILVHPLCFKRDRLNQVREDDDDNENFFFKKLRGPLVPGGNEYYPCKRSGISMATSLKYVNCSTVILPFVLLLQFLLSG